MMAAYIILLVLCFSSTYCEAKGLRKDLMYGEEIHTKSKKVDDPITRKIKSSFIECVDIHKQPAFDHPLLKNHTIQMKPSFKLGKDLGRPLRYDKVEIEFFEDTICPNGLVPIQKKKDGELHPLVSNDSGQHLATLRVDDAQYVYHGGSAFMSIEQPPVGPDQLSAGLIWISSGPLYIRDEIYFGWMVQPRLYGDNLSRLTALWTGNNYRNFCYNTICPGFVQINGRQHLGSTFYNVSSPKQQLKSLIEIVQDKESGNWWLMLTGLEIGYYPKELFTHLSKGANKVEFGGATTAPSGHPNPPMGRGTYATNTSATSSVFSRIQTYDANYNSNDIDPNKRNFYIDSKKCYSISYLKYNQNDRVAFSYGGPGGVQCSI